MENFNSGAKIDERPPLAQAKDYSHLEVGSTSSTIWHTKAEAEVTGTLYLKRDQKSTSSCGAHATELALSIDTGVLHEQAFIYRERINYPSEGMFHWDTGDILYKLGACEYLGINKTEKDYNAYIPTSSQLANAKSFSGRSYIILENDKFTIDDIAFILNNLKRPLRLHVYWNDNQWSTRTPISSANLLPNNAKYHHFVTALPNSAYIENGKKYFIIQDSAWFGGFNVRTLGEDWVNNQTYAGIYQLPLSIKPITKTVSFHYVFTQDLDVGSRNLDVIKLQYALQELGYFPSDIVPTGYFGGITRQAVKDFQKAYFNAILQAVGLKTPTGFFGSSTRKQLNKLMKA
jgi:hypothetical protein